MHTLPQAKQLALSRHQSCMHLLGGHLPETKCFSLSNLQLLLKLLHPALLLQSQAESGGQSICLHAYEADVQ